MADPFISSDPNAWLRPYWQRLHQQQSFFANLAPELQANALADALAADHPNTAAEIREWNATTRRAMLACSTRRCMRSMPTTGEAVADDERQPGGDVRGGLYKGRSGPAPARS